jgi:hypothetical protein
MVGFTVEDRPRILYLLVATARETPTLRVIYPPKSRSQLCKDLR